MSTVLASSSSLNSSSTAPSMSSSPMNPFPLPSTDASKEVWQKFIKDSTERVDGVDPDLAQVICLGDIHTEKWQDAWRAGLIDHFGSDGDIVLKEGWVSGNRIAPFIAKFMLQTQKNVSAYGCDDDDLIKATKAEIKTILDLTEKYHENAPSSRWSAEDAAVWNKACEQLETNCMLRSQIMIKTVRAFLKDLNPKQKIFIIAGSDHFFNDNGYKIVNSLWSARVCSILPKDVSQNKDASLIQGKTLLKG